MRIDTKYSVGDKVYLVDENKIKQAKITSLKIECYSLEGEVNYKIFTFYGFDIDDCLEWKTDSELFKTKRELREYYKFRGNAYEN